MNPKFKKPVFISSGALLIGVAAYFYHYHFFTAPSREEFFAENPQLASSVEMMTPTPTPVRETDEFKSGDFKLEKGSGYRISYESTLKNLTQPKKSFTSKQTGSFLLASDGIEKGMLWVLTRYQNTTSLKGAQKKSRNINQSETDLLIGMHPQGGIQRLFVRKPLKSFDEILEPFELLELALARIEDKTPGKRKIKRPDATFKATYLDEEVTPKGPNELQISLGMELKQNPFGSDENRAAARGTPGVGLFGIEQVQKVRYRWMWRSDMDRPVDQLCESENRITLGDQILGEINSSHELVWTPETRGVQEFLRKRPEFKFEINPEHIRAYIQSRNQTAITGKGRKGPERLKITPVSEILAGLRNLDRRVLTALEKDQLLIDLAQQLKSNPKLVPEVLAQAKDAVGGSSERSILLGALAFEGGPESQKAMIEIYRLNNATFADKSKIMIEFASANGPLTSETKSFLVSEFESKSPLADDLSNSAGLALGTSISYDGDPSMVKYIREKYASADRIFTEKPDETNEKRYMLSVMGNSKSNVFEKEVTAAAHSDKVTLAKAAANATRFAQTQSLRELLIDYLAHHPNSSIRKAAVEAMAYQPFDAKTVDALRGCCLAESHLPTRIECYKVLTRHVNMPQIREFLSSRQSAERDDQVINLIAAALSIQSEER